MNILRTLARPLLAAPFILDGIDAVMHPRVHAARSQEFLERLSPVVDRLGVEVSDEQLTIASRVMGAVSVAAGVGLASGVAPRSCAAVLCALSVPVAVVNAPEAIADRSFGDLSRRAALVGALAIASTDRQGSPSAAWRVQTWREQRRRARELSAVVDA